MRTLYIYKDGRPVGIIDRIDQKTVDEINKISEIQKFLSRECYLKPIHPGDFVFDPETGQKMWSEIEKFEYPEFSE